MMKVLEHCVADLDIMPGNQNVDNLAAQAPDAATRKNPTSEGNGVAANAKNAAAVGGTLGGGVNGVLDTTGNTVGALAGGLGGTVQGVDDGIGASAKYVGGTVRSGVSGVGDMIYLTGTGKKKTGAGEDVIEQTKGLAEDTTDKAKSVTAGALETVQVTAGTATD